MSRIDRMISRFTSSSTLGASDGAQTIDRAEAAKLAKVIDRSEPARERAAAKLLSTPGMFADASAEAIIRRACKQPIAPATQPATQPVGITAVRTESARVFATVNGEERWIGESTAAHPVLTTFGNGRYLAFSDSGSMGGFEMEGQAVRVYDSVTGATTTVLDEYYMIADIVEHKGKDGRSYLTVEMFGGGRGEDRVAIVDPTRGELYEAGLAALVGFDGNAFAIEHYNDDDYDLAMEEDRKPKVDSVETITLEELAKRTPIVNEPDDVFGEGEIPDDASYAVFGNRVKVRTPDGEMNLSSFAFDVWPSADGQYLAYSEISPTGSGAAWADDRQALYLYSFDRQKTSLVFDAKRRFDDVALERSNAGRLVILAKTAEEGWDFPTVTLVDPRDGDKQSYPGGIVSVKNGVATIKQYSEEQWEAAEFDPTKLGAPKKTVTLDLDAFVNR